MYRIGHKKTEPAIDMDAIALDPNIPDFSKSPFIIKKVERAKAFIAKHGLPKEAKPKKVK